jgi:hypothetical protein
MRLYLFATIFTALVYASEAGKKRKGVKPVSDSDSLLSRSSTVLSDIVSTHTLLQTGFKSFCEYFESFPRNLRADEVSIFTFITQFLCNMRPVLEGHGAVLQRALVSLSEGTDSSSIDKMDRARDILQTSFETVIEVQESISKIAESFPSLADGLKEVKIKSSIFGIKIKQLKQLIATQRTQWPSMTEAYHSVLTDVQSYTPSVASTESEDTTTTTESSSVDATTIEPSILMTEQSSIDTAALGLAADQALRAAVEVRNSMGNFLTAFGSMRRAVGKDLELNKRLDEMLAFPSVRALAWEKFVGEFATLARDLNDHNK